MCRAGSDSLVKKTTFQPRQRVKRQQRVQGVTHFQHMISHSAFGLDKDLVDHGVTMVTIHFMDAVLVKFGQRQQHP